MHEHSLMRGLMDKIAACAKEQNACKVLSISIRLGALCHISPDHFIEHFNDAATGTVAEGARVNFSQSMEMDDPRAQDILLESLELESRK